MARVAMAGDTACRAYVATAIPGLSASRVAEADVIAGCVGCGTHLVAVAAAAAALCRVQRGPLSRAWPAADKAARLECSDRRRCR